VRIAVNLLWLVPGGVGGSEEYVTRQLQALAETDQDQLSLFALPGLAKAHPRLAAKVDIIEAPIDGRRRELRVLVERTWLTWRLRRARFDVVHHAGGTVPWGSPGPIVTTMHDIQYVVFPETFSPWKLRYLRRVVPASMKRSDIVVTPSRFVADTIARAFAVPPERLVVAPNAVPDMRTPTVVATLRERYRLSGPVVLFPAITYRHKNHTVLLRAIQPIMRADPTLRLVLLGGRGPFEREVQAEVDRLGIGSQVVRPGRVPNDDLHGLIALADVLAFPSRYEGFGIPVLEAMAAGCPVIASSATALPEAVGDAGLLVDPDDVSGWTAALEQVLSNHTLSARLRANGYRRAAEFTPERSAAGLREAYVRALGGQA
jgi:glycosyltransferase involved in cell wall biosynthesis